MGKTGTVADPACQSGVREERARQRHAADGCRQRSRRWPAATAHRARGLRQSHREDRTLRAAHGGRHRRCGRRRGVVLRRHRQPVAGALGVPARPCVGRRPGVAERSRLAAGPSAARSTVTTTGAGQRGKARRWHTLVPADAVRHIRLRNSCQLDGHALIGRACTYYIIYLHSYRCDYHFIIFIYFTRIIDICRTVLSFV